MTNNGQTPGGNTTTATGEQLHMARRIADRWGVGSTEWIAARAAALAAITETTEAAAKLADDLIPIPGNPRQTVGTYAQGVFEVAKSLRSNAHLKAPKP